MANPPRDSRTPSLPSDREILHSTTVGRQRFPDLLQRSFGEKSVIGFDRYGRALGAVVPMEAVCVLAGCAEQVDEDVRLRIERAAQSLLKRVADGAVLCGVESEQPTKLVEMDELARRRKSTAKHQRGRTG